MKRETRAPLRTAMNKRSIVSIRSFAILSAIVAAFAVVGCSTKEDDDLVSPAISINRSGSALSLDLASIDGVFGAGCSGHTENEPWSAAVDEHASLSYAVLRVRRNDATCTLKLTHVHTPSTSYAAAPALALGATFAAPSAFNDDGQSAIDFHGTAKLGDPTFAGDFTLDLLFSDATTEGETQTEGADGFEHSFTVTQANVPAPDFGVNTSGHTLWTDPDDVVTTSTGSFQLTLNTQTAQAYAVVGSLLSTGMSAEDLETAFQASTHSGTLASPYEIAASELDLLGQDLTDGVQRSIILRNTDEGVSSYQVLRFDFRPSAE